MGTRDLRGQEGSRVFMMGTGLPWDGSNPSVRSCLPSARILPDKNIRKIRMYWNITDCKFWQIHTR